MKANTGLKEAHRAYKIFSYKSLYSSSSYFSLCVWSLISHVCNMASRIVRYSVWLSIIAAFWLSVFLSSVKDNVCTSCFDVARHVMEHSMWMLDLTHSWISFDLIWSLLISFDLIWSQRMSWWAARATLLMVWAAPKSWRRWSTSNWELLLPLGSIRSE